MVSSLSIIVLNYNTYELTCNCLRSIYNSDINDLDLEVILIDNGSTEVCERTFKDLFPDIIFIKNDVNLGFARGNNLGLAHATKSYVLLLNSDTVITDPQTFIKTIALVREHNDKIVLTTRLLTAEGVSQVAYGYLPGLRMEFLFTTFLYKLFRKEKMADLLVRFVSDQNRLIEKGYTTATYYLFARRLIDLLPKRKLYDDTFMYGEELFWATDWIRLGIRMFYLSEVSIIHLVGKSSSSLENHKLKMRRMYQVRAEHSYLLWRYKMGSICLIYFLRITRFLLLSPFDKDIRMRLLLLVKVIFNKS